MRGRTFVVAAIAVTGCGLRPYDFGGGATETTGDPATGTTAGFFSSSGEAATTTGTSGGVGSTGDTGTSGSSSSGSTAPSFILMPDGGPGDKCDIFEQGCPEGQKCMPYSGDGDNSWETTRCVPIVRDPAGLYEPCEILGSGVDGLDTCDINLMCWDLDQEGKGVCWGQCMGSPDSPTCEDPKAYCYWGRSALSLCIPHCDPLLQDCGAGDVCIPNQDSFICVLDASGDEGQVFDPCEYANACDPGLLCATPTIAPQCDPMWIGCCVPFCGVSAPDCPDGLECLPWYEPGMALPGYEDIGVCGVAE